VEHGTTIRVGRNAWWLREKKLVAEGVQQSSNFLPKLAPGRAKFWRLPIIFLATGACAGFSPVFPGTVGSILGLLLIRCALGSFSRSSPAGFLMLFGIVFITSCRVADWAEEILGEADSSAIVLDEILGMIATMFANPLSWAWLMGGFTLFRLFDIIKPWPASRFDRMHGGAGVMLDDLAAALLRRLV
jgi:phosphatidylglycerophosphatase A